MHVFRYQSNLPVRAEFAYAWHTREGAFERLVPPWVDIAVRARRGTIEDGEVELALRLGPVKLPWHAQHSGGVPGREFHDRSARGPFAVWEHTHRFVPTGAATCRMEDEVRYRLLRLPVAEGCLDRVVVQRKLQRQFAYRHRVLAHDLRRHRDWSSEPLHFAITGASGLVGSTLCAFLAAGGHRVTRLVRGTPRQRGEASWNPATGAVQLPSGDPVDVVVHLAGANVGEGRWTPRRKAEIRASRVDTTAALAAHVAQWRPAPRAFLVASAIGYYGNRGSEWLDESSSAGGGFLAAVCQDWEAASRPAENAGIRVVRVRIGVVLTPRGGALSRLWWPFWLGVGGPTGSGAQYISWIAPDDLVAIFLYCATDARIRGVVNAVAPEPVTNADFTRALARVLRRPAFVPFPAAAVRWLFGEMGDELLLSSTRVRPARLLDFGFDFAYPRLDLALAHVLGAA